MEICPGKAFKPEQRDRETRRANESLAADHCCTVSKTDVRISILAISFRVLVYGHAQQICEAVIAMHYPESGVKGRITNGSQCPIITASPEEHGRLGPRRERGGHTMHRQRCGEDNTKLSSQFKFPGVYYSCPFA